MHHPSLPPLSAWIRLAGLHLFGLVSALVAQPAHADETQAIPVTAIDAHSETLDRVVNGIGTVASLQSVTVRPRIDGQVVDVPFTEGQMVQKGRVLLKLDDRELISAVHYDDAMIKSAERSSASPPSSHRSPAGLASGRPMPAA